VIGLVLSFLSGYIALSYEILWYRAYSFTSMGTADAFALLLGAYLTGLALGAWASRVLCRVADAAAAGTPFPVIRNLTLAGNALGFLVVPALGWLVSKGCPWRMLVSLAGAAALGLGALFPVISHAWIPPDGQVGRRVSYMYLANILGSTLGSLLTGMVLMDHLTLAQISVVLGVLGLVIAGALHAKGSTGSRRLAGLGALGAAAVVLMAGGGSLYDGLYEKLQFHGQYTPSTRFAHVVETKSGVITVTKEGRIYGGGIYDGAFNTSLREKDDLNSVIRPYALAEMHPSPREVLMIGLSSGSWATIVANNPAVEHLTIIEINAGYLRLIPQYPAVAGLLTNPKVRIEIDDGRRWLVRNPERRFDLIVSNTTFHWRSNASNLLSKEFMELIRSHLREGGVFFYNTTASRRVMYTGASVFRHALRVMYFQAVSDSPIPMDLDRLKRRLWSYPWEGGTLLDRSHPGDEERMERVIADLSRQLERDDSLRAPGVYARMITDDNMGTEWEEAP